MVLLTELPCRSSFTLRMTNLLLLNYFIFHTKLFHFCSMFRTRNKLKPIIMWTLFVVRTLSSGQCLDTGWTPSIGHLNWSATGHSVLLLAAAPILERILSMLTTCTWSSRATGTQRPSNHARKLFLFWLEALKIIEILKSLEAFEAHSGHSLGISNPGSALESVYRENEFVYFQILRIRKLRASESCLGWKFAISTIQSSSFRSEWDDLDC